ncbi:MAG: hypothetical protein QOJ07_3261 [Thermoleophilaceae bacterium]|nr:hypothetical protein [Thermoleophilaceae bacterium]
MADVRTVVPSTTIPRGAADAAPSPAPPASVRQLWLANLADASGHADGNRAFLTAVERHGYEPALRMLRWDGGNSAGLSPGELLMMDRQKRRLPSGPVVSIHSYPAFDRQFVVKETVNVARAVFETDRIPQSWLTPLLDRDEIWVPSRFNVESFVRGGIPEERLRVVGDTIDTTRFHPGVEPWDLGAPEGSFVFLTNFDFSERKGWQQLMVGWAKAFGRDDDVCLVLKVGSFYTDAASVIDRISSYVRQTLGRGAAERMAPIRFLTETLPTSAMPRLYAGADAYVLPSRGEGVGRPFMEAMATGLPTIASNWSGNLEFMDPASTWLVDGNVVDVSDDAELANDLYFGHRWFEADTDALAEALREIASDPAAARAKAAPARDELERRFGTEAIARRFQELSEAAWDKHSELRLRPVHSIVRGPAGSVDSLAVGNDALANGLIAKGLNVRLRAPKANALNDDAPGVSQCWPPVFEPATDGPSVMILPWEFGVSRADWVMDVRRRIDRVWVPSEYVRRGYIESGMPPGVVEVIPSGADTELFKPEGPIYPLPHKAGCTFLFVGGSTWRKGIDVLLEGWRRAFGPGDDVQLVIKDFGVRTAYKNQTNAELIERSIAGGKFAPMTYIDDDLPHEDLPSLYRAADVVVLPYRAEGFCLPAVEAMACGVPVIHNGQGPTGEFVGDIGGWPLPSKRVIAPSWLNLPDPVPGTDYYVHDVDPADLAERLRAVAADTADRHERGARGVIQAQEYTWARFADRAEASLARLVEEDLPFARTLRRTEIEARTHFALFAPDWDDDAAWGPALDAWLGAFGPGDDVTLALYVDGDAEAVGARVMGRLAGRAEDSLPDLALVEAGPDVTLFALAACADAVLVDAPAEPADNPPLLRRARRIVPADPAALAALARELGDE